MQGYGDGRSCAYGAISPTSQHSHPSAVIEDRTLSPQQKRSILAHWASDACAVDSDPTLRLAPGSLRPVKVGDVFAALAALDAPSPSRRQPMPDVLIMPPRMPISAPVMTGA